MKQSTIIAIAGAAAIAVLGAVALPLTRTASADITADRAREIALADAGLTEADTRYLRTRADYDDGRSVYEVEFYADGTEYDYEIAAAGGAILSKDYDAEGYAPSAAQLNSSAGDIGADRAKEIALADAGLTEADTQYLRTKADYDDGRSVYEVEFYADGTEYDYEIAAADGAILSKDYDAEGYAPSAAQPAGSSADITEDRAREIALADAGLTEADAQYLRTKADYDDGRSVYEVEFYADGTEYDYEIAAADGAILSKDYDAEGLSCQSGSSTEAALTEAEARAIVAGRAGVEGTFRELKLDRDDGRLVYEGEMRSGAAEYEFEIDAVTGAVLSWEVE